MMVAADPTTEFAYEIGRAKKTLGTYGTHSFRDERVHVRRARRGSTTETFCATTQARDTEGRVDERVFY